ncbi:MAG TPA: DUF4169 family protein [Pseudolabrys sp.]|jgi:hypothetical protein|nr:DUF4169 family protein [Pseudolabrys sp.]
MAELINLRHVRKRAERLASETKAAANRLAHGRPKSERQVQRARQDKMDRTLDAHRIDKEDSR